MYIWLFVSKRNQLSSCCAVVGLVVMNLLDYLQDALDSGDCNRIRVSLRFLTVLVCCSNYDKGLLAGFSVVELQLKIQFGLFTSFYFDIC